MLNPHPNFIARFTRRVRQVFNEYPRQFWLLIAGSFIDQLGGALLFPFFSLYITKKFAVGMTEVGVIFGLFAITSLVGSLLGGALTDRMGRKGIIIFGLVTSALSSVLMGLVETLPLFLLVILLVGLLSNSAGPARQAMVADMLPDHQRAQGFGILRVVANLAVTIGPLIGGLLASWSYLALFLTDAVTSLVTAVIIFLVIRETMQPRPEGEPQESMRQTFSGYGLVLRDLAFLWFMLAGALMVLVYVQMNSSLSVFLRDLHGVDERGFSYILSLNAAMVVLMQFSVTRWVSRFRPLVVMTVGTLMYAVGFAMYGFVGSFILFLTAMVIITMGEMFVSPVSQAIAASLAPADMRGRYMAVYGLSWTVPFAIGPLLAGLVMDNLDPRWVWYGAGLLGVAAALAYFLLERQIDRVRWKAVSRRLGILQQVESGELSAERAAGELAAVSEGSWGRLADGGAAEAQRYLRVRQKTQGINALQLDLRIPLGLVNAALAYGGRISDALDTADEQRLQRLVAAHAAPNTGGSDDGQGEGAQFDIEVEE